MKRENYCTRDPFWYNADSKVALDFTEGANEHSAAAQRYPHREHRLLEHYHADVRNVTFMAFCTLIKTNCCTY